MFLEAEDKRGLGEKKSGGLFSVKAPLSPPPLLKQQPPGQCYAIGIASSNKIWSPVPVSFFVFLFCVTQEGRATLFLALEYVVPFSGVRGPRSSYSSFYGAGYHTPAPQEASRCHHRCDSHNPTLHKFPAFNEQTFSIPCFWRETLPDTIDREIYH